MTRAALYIASLLATSIASAWILRAPPVCGDILSSSGIVARTSLGALLPIPAIQNCTGSGIWLAVVLVCGCTAASLAWVALLRAGMTRRLALGLYALSAVIGLSFPYVSTTDAYAYALYGYEAGVAHASPYRVQNLSFTNTPAFAPLAKLFPNRHTGIRIANYGPAFVALYSAVALASRGSLLAAIILARTLSAISLLSLALTVRRAAPFVIAPILVFQLIAFAHSDACMLALLGAAWMFYRKNSIPACCVAIVLAGEVKGVAFFAFGALLIDLMRSKRRRETVAAVLVTAAALTVTAAISYGVFGTFSLGGPPAISPLSSPAMIVAAFAGGSNAAIKIFAAMQLALGLSFAAKALLRRRADLAAAAATASLPSVFPWYCCWLVSIGAISNDDVFTQGAIVLACVAIAGEIGLMIANVPLWAGACIVTLVWGAPALIYLRAASSDARRWAVR